MSWEKRKFGELFLEPARNGIYKSAEAHGKGSKIVNMGEIFAYTFVGKQEMQRIDMSAEELIRFGLKNGDLLFARRSLVESGAGKAAMVLDLSEPVTFESSIIRVRLNIELCVPMFYLYWMRSLAGRNAIGALVSGTNVKGIRGSELQNILVDFPPIQTQTKIASILNNFDKVIEKNQQQIKLLEEAAQRLYKEWFVDLHFPGYEKTPVADGVPEGWEYRTLSSFGNIITGKTPATSKTDNYGDSVPFVKIPDMHGNIYPLRTELMLSDTGAESQRGKFIPPRSLLVSCIATVGLVNITIERCQTNQQINALIPNNCCDLYYLFFAIRDKKETLIAIGSNGATMTNVNKEKFGKVKVLYPSEELVKEYNAFATDIFEKVLRLSKSIIHLQTVRDFLLTKLMNRELEV